VGGVLLYLMDAQGSPHQAFGDAGKAQPKVPRRSELKKAVYELFQHLMRGELRYAVRKLQFGTSREHEASVSTALFPTARSHARRGRPTREVTK
jgi:aldehyde:ferredoxin oxidoreductase